MRHLFLLCFCITRGIAQVTGVLTTIHSEPIPYANLLIYTAADSVFVSGTNSDEQGRFILNAVPTTSFYIKVTCIGYQSLYTKPFLLSQTPQNLDIGPLTLLEETNYLDEITVSTKKSLIQVTPIGKIINVQSSLMTRGSNALQVLERMPGVITDHRNNQFSLNGQSGVTVMFNGRKISMAMSELMNLLENTMADNIEKIELITSPTANYDADGGAGIINIVFKKNEGPGTQFNFSVMAGYGFKLKDAFNAGLSHSFKKVKLYASYSFLHDERRSGYQGAGMAGPSFMLGETANTFYGFSSQYQNNHNANLSLEYPLNKKSTLGAEWMHTFGESHSLVNNGGTYDFMTGDFLRVDGLSDGLNHKQNVINSVYYRHRYSEKSGFSLDYSHIDYTDDSPTMISTDYYDKANKPVAPANDIFISGNRGQSFSSIKVHVLQADIDQALAPALHGAFGAKISHAQNTNDSRVERKQGDAWTIDPRSQSDINSRELLMAAYAQFKYSFPKKSILQLGLRYEYWRRAFNVYTKPFLIAQFFPFALFTHTFSERSSMNIHYSRRISRPAYSDLVSNLFYVDPTFVFSGNPLLKPTLIDALKVDYRVSGLHIGLAAQYEKKPILRYQITTNSTRDIGISSPQNLDFQKSLNLYINHPVQLFSWWNLTLASTTSWRDYQVSYSLNPARKTYLFQNLNFSQSLQLPGKVELELDGWYNFASFEGTNSVKGFGLLNLALAKDLPKNKGRIQLAVPDLLRSFSVHTHISGMTPIVFNINTVSNWRDETALYRVVKLTYSRNLGKSKDIKIKELTTEEKERLK